MNNASNFNGLSFLLLSFLFFGCPPTPIFLEDVRLNESPNELDKVGTVYFIDKKGAEQPLGSLPENILPKIGEAELPKIEGVRTTDIKVIAEILKLPSNVKFERKKEVYYKMEFAKAELERLELLTVQNELEKMSFDIKKFFKHSKKLPKCYIITESYKAKEANIIFSQKKSFEQSASINKIELGNAQDTLRINDVRVYSLNKKFDRPLYIGKKVYGLELSGSGLSGNVKFEINAAENGFIKKD